MIHFFGKVYLFPLNFNCFPYVFVGLYANSKSNLNTPLLGVWNMNHQAVRAVTGSITDLQKRVVNIIPFTYLTVDTRLLEMMDYYYLSFPNIIHLLQFHSKYFSGGSARVYKGTYLKNEVIA